VVAPAVVAPAVEEMAVEEMAVVAAMVKTTGPAFDGISTGP